MGRADVQKFRMLVPTSNPNESRWLGLQTAGRAANHWNEKAIIMRKNTQTPHTNAMLRPLRIGMRTGRGFRLLPTLLVLARLAGSIASEAATVWTGPVTTFTDPAGSDPTLPANQDRLTPNVWITRGLENGIYNAKNETGFTHFFSPADAEWADGTTANYSSLSYTDWNTWAKNIHGGPPSTVGVNAVAHLISDNIYLDVQFTSWAVTGGGFSYQRSTPPTANAPPSVSITNPAAGASFIAPTTVTIQAAASDSDGSVTNVQFFDGASSLGNATLSPYGISAGLALGSHTLTAVASDNFGATTTSASVTVTVVSNSPPTVSITSPTNAASFTAPATIIIAATASDLDGTVTNVQFFDGVSSLGSITSSPYSILASLSVGTHTLTAAASDNPRFMRFRLLPPAAEAERFLAGTSPVPFDPARGRLGLLAWLMHRPAPGGLCRLRLRDF
jgi:hypothetical protein